LTAIGRAALFDVIIDTRTRSRNARYQEAGMKLRDHLSLVALVIAVALPTVLAGCGSRQPSKCAQARDQLHQTQLSIGIGKGDVGATAAATVQSAYTNKADQQIYGLQASYDLMCENADNMDDAEWDCEMQRHAQMIQAVSHARVQMDFCADEACQQALAQQYSTQVQALMARSCSPQP
jgi:hypothetical protein